MSRDLPGLKGLRVLLEWPVLLALPVWPVCKAPRVVPVRLGRKAPRVLPVRLGRLALPVRSALPVLKQSPQTRPYLRHPSGNLKNTPNIS